MFIFFFLLFLLSVPTFIIGLINPRLLRKIKIQTRKQTLYFLGGGMVLLFILFVATAPKETVNPATIVNKSTPTITPEDTHLKPIKASTKQSVKQSDLNTANIPPKVLGRCSTASTGNYTVTNCVNIQLPGFSSPSRLIYVVIDPSNDSPKAKVQTVANEANTLCGTVSDCVVDIFDDTQATSEQYKEDLLSQVAREQYIKDPKNSDATTLTIDHLIADFIPPNIFTYYFIPTPTPTVTPTPIAYDANGFPEDAQQVTVADIAKIPGSYSGKKVTFTCSVASFPKDSNGNAAGLNCVDPNDYSSILQVQMGTFDDSVKINQNDSVAVYGIGQGSASGENAFGGQVSEATVLEIHLKDYTTGYNE